MKWERWFISIGLLITLLTEAIGEEIIGNSFDLTVPLNWQNGLFQGGEIRFLGSGKDFRLSVSPFRFRFLSYGQLQGFSEWLLSSENLPTNLKVQRIGARWQVCLGRRLVAYAIADLPKTERVSAQFNDVLSEVCLTKPISVQRRIHIYPSDGWVAQTLPDGSIAWAPVKLAEQTSVTILKTYDYPETISDFTVSAEIQPNSVRSIGVGFCFDQDGGYVWRWLKELDETKLQLLAVQKENDKWQTEILSESFLPLVSTSWHKLQVWHCADQILAGLDDEVLVQVSDRRYSFGRLVIWVEGVENPLPLIRSITVQPWYCMSLTHSNESGIPFPALIGHWKVKASKWSLQSDGKFATAILSDVPLPSWWCVETEWNGEAIGLIWGWLDEQNFGLLRLKSLFRPVHSPSFTSNIAVAELVVVRRGKEKIVDRQNIWLNQNIPYKIAVQLLRGRLVGFINGTALLQTDAVPIGKVGIWAETEFNLKKFWMFTAETPSLPPIFAEASAVQPFVEQGSIAHEKISLTISAGIPPNIPLSARLSQVPVELIVERRQHRIWFRLLHNGQRLTEAVTLLPSKLPLIIQLEKREQFIFVWMGEKLVITARLP